MASLRTTVAVALTCMAATVAEAQTSIPLQLISEGSGPGGAQRLQIMVGINGGAPQPYMFDTGSSLFNAAYNPAWWGGVPPSSSLPANVQYCYGTGGATCRGFVGNLVQVQSLSFPGATGSLTANPGYVVNAAYSYAQPGASFSFPSYFATTDAPFIEDHFYGIFGTGNFANLIAARAGAGRRARPDHRARPGAGLRRRRQQRPDLPAGEPAHLGVRRRQRPRGHGCSPCVTVGLTPQMLGQFIPVGLPSTNPFAGSYPGNPALAGLVPVPVGPSFANPYGGSQGNNGSTEYGANFALALMRRGETSPAFSQTSPTLLDSGTPVLLLTSNAGGLIGSAEIACGHRRRRKARRARPLPA